MSSRQTHIRLSNEMHEKLKMMAKGRGLSQNLIINSAVESFLDESMGGGGKSEEVKKELFELKRRIIALKGDVEVLGELLSYFIYHWLGYTPKLEKAERVSLAAEAKERHQKFMEMFAKKLTIGDLSLAPVVAKGIARVDEELEQEESGSEEM